MTKVGGIRKIKVLWQAVFLAAPPSNLTRLYYNGSAAKSHSTTTQYRQLRRLLRWSFHSMKAFNHVFVLLAVFEFSCLLLRVLISSSCNHGNLSFVLELLKMEKFGKFSSLNSSMLSTTMATCPAFSADVC